MQSLMLEEDDNKLNEDIPNAQAARPMPSHTPMGEPEDESLINQLIQQNEALQQQNQQLQKKNEMLQKQLAESKYCKQVNDDKGGEVYYCHEILEFKSLDEKEIKIGDDVRLKQQESDSKMKINEMRLHEWSVHTVNLEKEFLKFKNKRNDDDDEEKKLES
eukprot:152693_1